MILDVFYGALLGVIFSRIFCQGSVELGASVGLEFVPWVMFLFGIAAILSKYRDDAMRRDGYLKLAIWLALLLLMVPFVLNSFSVEIAGIFAHALAIGVATFFWIVANELVHKPMW